ncbi:hypothetical protein Poly51_49080 [Rubripirellula tenax]|uniref:Uncharacterized protein n=1 Tax=Rubripirellula tenax TaxID=2528015 RepID=A0A5C6EKM9_9BACT|nr:hypothetical protein Poly51_49080 [Rubripirellula tenax]
MRGGAGRSRFVAVRSTTFDCRGCRPTLVQTVVSKSRPNVTYRIAGKSSGHADLFFRRCGTSRSPGCFQRFAMPEACGSSGIGMVYSAASCRNADTLANGSICLFPPGLAIGERVRVSAPFVRRARPADGRQRSKLAARFNARYAVERWSPLPIADSMLDSMQWDNHGMHRSGGGAVFSKSRFSPPPGDANRSATEDLHFR